MKGISIISEVLFLAIVVSLVFLVYAMSAPVIQTMQVSAALEQAESFMLNLDSLIQEVASEREGGRRSFHLSMGAGTVSLGEDNDTIKWVLNSDSPVISPRSMQKLGNLIIGSNLNTMAYEGNHSGQEAYVLENEHLRVFVKKIGSAASHQQYNTSDLLLGVYNKDLSEWLGLDRLEISVDNSTDSTNGTGYTELVEEGNALPYGKVLAHINTSYSFTSSYNVTFTLESGADFITLEAEV
jgi:hypothetical protein